MANVTLQITVVAQSPGEMMRNLRRATGVSQMALADAINKRQPAISRMENGLQKVRKSDFAAALSYFGVPQQVVSRLVREFYGD